MQPDNGHQPDYNFIMNPAKPRRQGLFGGGGDKKQRILIVAIVGGVLLLVFMILFNVIFGGSNNNTEKLFNLAKQQNELVRVAQIGEKQAVSSTTKNLATTVDLTLSSGQQATTTLLTKEGKKINAKQLAAGQNTQTDTTLNQATQANHFDEVFTSTMQTQLQSYLTNLSDLYKATKSPEEKALLQNLYNQTKSLVTTKANQ